MSRRKVQITIYDGDDLAELQRLRLAVRDALAAEQETDATLADVGAEEARIEYNEFLKVAKARGDEVTLQALPRRHWRKLRTDHPPREVEVTTEEDVTTVVDDVAEDGTKTKRAVTEQKPVTEKAIHEDDEELGVNTETLPDELLAFTEKSKDPELPDVATIAEAPAGFDLDDLSEPDFDRLFIAALMLNRQYVDPKELSAFAQTPENDET